MIINSVGMKVGGGGGLLKPTFVTLQMNGKQNKFRYKLFIHFNKNDFDSCFLTELDHFIQLIKSLRVLL